MRSFDMNDMIYAFIFNFFALALSQSDAQKEHPKSKLSKMEQRQQVLELLEKHHIGQDRKK